MWTVVESRPETYAAQASGPNFAPSLHLVEIYLPVAVIIAARQIIGRDGGLPWQPPFGPGLPSDMQHFRETTRGGVLIVGRHTFGERGAPYDHARHTIVVSRDADGSIQDSGAVVVSSLDIAISTARQLLPEEEESNDPAHEPIWICGGQRVYEEAIKKRLAHTLWLTVVNHDFAGKRHNPKQSSLLRRGHGKFQENVAR